MNVATRITVTTAVVVAVASAGYAAIDLGSRTALRRVSTEVEARAVASTLRLALEAPAPGFRTPSQEALASLSRASGGWAISVIPRELETARPSATLSAGQITRLRALIDLPEIVISEVDGESGLYHYAIALRAVAPRESDRRVLALLELSKPAAAFRATGGDIARALSLIAIVVIATTVVVGLLASRIVSRPIAQLLRGIDDVAKGDLSHVLLSEHDDELGAIATRFNEMTYSLRESRAETLRQNEAKLALEQRLGQTEKLATLGQLAAEIAHEVGTPLNVIAGRARAMQRKARDPEVVEKNASIVAEQTARITRIIQRLLDFTRRKVGAPEHVRLNLNELALTTVELLGAQFSAARVRTRLDRAEGLPVVVGDADRLQQVLINLLLNAVQATPEGGSVWIETLATRRTRPGLELGAEQVFVSLVVSDTGVGIPPAIRDKVFDPFFTTKEGQGGTGLGLAVCSGIVKEHDGWIEVDDTPGGGTTFRVFLPTQPGLARQR
jgi:signal transduction histidine kinase